MFFNYWHLGIYFLLLWRGMSIFYKSMVCPYCKSHISLMKLLYVKDKSSFCCFDCKKRCEVVLNSGVGFLFAFIAVLSILIMCAFIFLFKKLLVGTFVLALLFSIFYMLVPNFIYVKPTTKSESCKSD